MSFLRLIGSGPSRCLSSQALMSIYRSLASIKAHLFFPCIRSPFTKSKQFEVRKQGIVTHP